MAVKTIGDKKHESAHKMSMTLYDFVRGATGKINEPTVKKLKVALDLICGDKEREKQAERITLAAEKETDIGYGAQELSISLKEHLGKDDAKVLAKNVDLISEHLVGIYMSEDDQRRLTPILREVRNHLVDNEEIK